MRVPKALATLQERVQPQELIELRAAAEARPIPAPPAPLPLGWGRAMLNHLKAADAPARDHYRYDPNRLLPRSAMVRQVRIERLPLRPCMGDVAELLERIETLVGA